MIQLRVTIPRVVPIILSSYYNLGLLLFIVYCFRIRKSSRTSANNRVFRNVFPPCSWISVGKSCVCDENSSQRSKDSVRISCSDSGDLHILKRVYSYWHFWLRRVTRLQFSWYMEGRSIQGSTRGSFKLRYDTSNDGDLASIGTVSLAVPCPTFIIHRLL